MASLSVRRGDTQIWTLTVRDAVGAIQPLAGLTVWWTVRPSVPASPSEDLLDSTALIKAWWSHNGSVVTNSGVVGPDASAGGSFVSASPATGQLVLTLLPSLTTKLPLAPTGGGQYRYDVQLLWTVDDVRTVDEGTLQIIADITRRTSVP